MTIYVDVLMVINLFINYALLLSTSVILKNSVSKLRLLLGASAGSVCGLIIFLPSFGVFIDLLIKLVISALIVFCSFGYSNFKKYLRSFLTFFAVNFSFCGIMYILWTFVAPTGMVFNNGIAYFNIDLKILAISTVMCFTVVSVITHFTEKKAPSNAVYYVTVENNEKKVRLTALSDTGNSLRESFTGYPVAVAEYGSIKDILPQSIRDYFENKNYSYENFRLIPHKTVAGTGVLPSFRPTKIIIENLTNKIETDKIYIAVTKNNIAQGEYEMILNSCIFEEENINEKIICKNQKTAVKAQMSE